MNSSTSMVEILKYGCPNCQHRAGTISLNANGIGHWVCARCNCECTGPSVPTISPDAAKVMVPILKRPLHTPVLRATPINDLQVRMVAISVLGRN